MTSSSEVRVRRAAPPDLDAVGAVLEAAYRGLVSDDYVDWMTHPSRWWEDATDVFVSEVDGLVVGTVTFALPGSGLFPSRDPAHADATFRLLGVRAEARGRGVATALVRACIDAARTAGARRIAIHTVESMLAARRLYDRLDFTRRADLDVAYPAGTGFAYVLDLTDDAARHFLPPGPVPATPPWHEDVHADPHADGDDVQVELQGQASVSESSRNRRSRQSGLAGPEA